MRFTISQNILFSRLIEEYTKITQSKIDARKIILLNNLENKSQKDLGNIIIETFCLQHTLKIVSLLTKYDNLKTKIILQNNTKPTFLVVFKPLKNGIYKSTCYFTNYDCEHSPSTNNEINYKELHNIITFALYNNLIIVDNNNNKFINSTNICKEQIDYRSIAYVIIEKLDNASENIVDYLEKEIDDTKLFIYVDNIKIINCNINKFCWDNKLFFIRNILDKYKEKYTSTKKGIILNPDYNDLFDKEKSNTTHFIFKKIYICDILKNLL